MIIKRWVPEYFIVHIVPYSLYNFFGMLILNEFIDNVIIRLGKYGGLILLQPRSGLSVYIATGATNRNYRMVKRWVVNIRHSPYSLTCLLFWACFGQVRG